MVLLWFGFRCFDFKFVQQNLFYFILFETVLYLHFRGPCEVAVCVGSIMCVTLHLIKAQYFFTCRFHRFLLISEE